MSQSPQHSIPDELLSAYIDGLVTEEERARIEAAMAADPEIAWQVETLRQTVRLLSELPPVPLPRSFVLTQAQVADVLMERQALASVSLPAPTPASPWSRLFVFLKGGNPVWRNAAAVAAILFLLLTVGDFARVTPLQRSTPQFAAAREVGLDRTGQESLDSRALPAPQSSSQLIAIPSTEAPAEEEAAVAAAEPSGAPAVRAAVPTPVQAAPAAAESEASAEDVVAVEAVPKEESLPEPAVGAASVLPSVEAGEAAAPPVAAEAPREAAVETIPAPPAAVAVAPSSAVPAEEQAEAAAPAAMAAPTLSKPTPTPQPPPTATPATTAEEPAPAEPAALAQAPPAQEEAPAPAQVPEAAEPAPTTRQPAGPAIPWEAVRWGLLGLTLLFALLWWRSRQGSERV